MMKHITLSALLLLAGVGTQAQVVFESDLESWTDGLPDDFMGAKTSIEPDSVIQVTENPHGGTSAVRLVNTPTVSGDHKRFTTQPMAVVAGQPYVVTFWARGAGQVRFAMFDERAGNGYSPYSNWTPVSGDWQQLTFNVLGAMNSAIGEFIISVNSTVGPEHVVIDDVTISLGEILPPVEATIQEIQETTDVSGNSPLMDQGVITGGIVTAVVANGSTNGYWIQNNAAQWNGIFVSDAGNFPAIGDSVTLTAMVQENFGLTRLNTVLDYTVVSSGNELPAASVITTAQANTEPYEGVLSQVVNVECVVLPNTFGEWTVLQGTDSLIVNDLMYAYTPTLGTLYAVTGPINYGFGSFSIEPRDLNDIELGNSIGEFAGVTVTLFPNPASNVLTLDLGGLTGRTEYTLHDATGRMVSSDVITAERGTIDVSALTNGAYVMTLRNSTGARWSTQVIVQH